jgi:3'(2'), 5'-bisphosphate nucleotidase
VAEGVADIYYRYGGSMQWDTAAMHAIAEEAGCIFRQMDGSEMTYNRKGLVNDKGFFVANRKENIFEDMLIAKEI